MYVFLVGVISDEDLVIIISILVMLFGLGIFIIIVIFLRYMRFFCYDYVRF